MMGRLLGYGLHLLHILEQAFEQGAGQVSFAGVRKNHHDGLAAYAGSRASRSAATIAAPQDMPQSIPSSRASLRAVAIASSC